MKFFSAWNNAIAVQEGQGAESGLLDWEQKMRSGKRFTVEVS